MELREKLTKNTGLVFISRIAYKVFSLIFVIYAARILGPENFGIYALIGTITFLFSFFGNFGINTMAVRDIASNKHNSEEIFNYVLTLKVGLVVLAYPLLIAAVNLLGYRDDIKYLIYIAGVSTIFSIFSSSFGILYMAFERFKMPSLIFILVSLLSTIANIAVLHLGFGLKGIIWVSFFGNLFGALISGIWVRIRFFKYRFAYNRTVYKNMWSLSLPFAIISFFQQANEYMNILFLSKLPGPIQGEIAIGYYNPPSTICRSAMMLPESFRQAALPSVSSNTKDLKMIENIINKSTKTLISTIILPLLLATTFFPKEIITIIFGNQYLPSVHVLTILGWAYALHAFNAPVSVTLAASKEIKKFIPWAAAVFVLNIILSIPLIIYYSYTGAALAFLISKLAETAIRHHLLKKIWGMNSFNLHESFRNIVLPAMLIFFVIYVSKLIGAGSLALLVVSIVMYTTCILFFKDFREGISVVINGIYPKIKK